MNVDGGEFSPDGRLTRGVWVHVAEAVDPCAASPGPTPACVLVEGGPGAWEIRALDHPDRLRSHPAWGQLEHIHVPGHVLIPGLVNAHAHLDLTGIGPRPFDACSGFVGWIDMVRRLRPRDEAAIRSAVREGIRLSVAGGTAAIGDIAGGVSTDLAMAPFEELRTSGMEGTSFLEFFGWAPGAGEGFERARTRVEALVKNATPLGGPVRVGVQPHAPYSVSRPVMSLAAARAGEAGVAICSHVGETAEERRFVARGDGPFREFLRAVGVWDEAIAGEEFAGRTPVGQVTEALSRAAFLLAHVNDASDTDIEALSRHGASVAYCPRASEYFGVARDLGAHRYRDMLAAGVNVCLGTDSIINLPEGSGRISVLDEMGLLARRDGTDPDVLLRMGTTHGARALGLGEGRFSLWGRPMGLVLVAAGQGPGRPWARALRHVGAASMVTPRTLSDFARA